MSIKAIGVHPYGISTASIAAKCAEKNKKNWLEYISKYVTTADGAGDLFGIIETGLEYLKKIPLKLKHLEHVDRVQGVANVAGSSLVFSDIISGGNKLWKNMNSPIRPTRELKKIADSLFFIGDVGKGVGFVHENKLAELGKSVPVANALYNGSYLIANSLGIVQKRQEIKGNKISIAQSRSELEKNYLSQKNNLKMLKIAQKVSSMVLSIIGLSALIIGYNMTGPGLIPAVVLTLSTAYLILHITNYFYGQVITDKLKP